MTWIPVSVSILKTGDIALGSTALVVVVQTGNSECNSHCLAELDRVWVDDRVALAGSELAVELETDASVVLKVTNDKLALVGRLDVCVWTDGAAWQT